jgi:hypothetical protein
VPGAFPFEAVEPVPELGAALGLDVRGELFRVCPEPCAGELGGGVLAPGTGELGGGLVAPGEGAFGDAVPGAGEADPGVGDAVPGVGDAVPGVGDAVPGVGDAVPGAGDTLPGAVWCGEFDDGLLPPCEADPDGLPCPEPCPAPEPEPEPEPELWDRAHVAPSNSTQKMVALAFINSSSEGSCPIRDSLGPDLGAANPADSVIVRLLEGRWQMGPNTEN